VDILPIPNVLKFAAIGLVPSSEELEPNLVSGVWLVAGKPGSLWFMGEVVESSSSPSAIAAAVRSFSTQSLVSAADSP
jgi:hypothetical protein